MKRLLIVGHAPSANTQALRTAVKRGACHEEVEPLICEIKAPLEAGPEDVHRCDAIVLGTTENLGYMSGALKDFFDRSYYSLLEHTRGLPCALYIRAGHDGTGTRRGVEQIVTGLGWRWVQPPLMLVGEWQLTYTQQAEELGLYMAAGLENGVF